MFGLHSSEISPPEVVLGRRKLTSKSEISPKNRQKIAPKTGKPDEKPGKTLRQKFDQIELMKKKIAKLRQSVISEIRSYASPPDGIHQVMMATYLLLGQREHDILVRRPYM